MTSKFYLLFLPGFIISTVTSDKKSYSRFKWLFLTFLTYISFKRPSEMLQSTCYNCLHEEELAFQIRSQEKYYDLKVLSTPFYSDSSERVSRLNLFRVPQSLEFYNEKVFASKFLRAISWCTRFLESALSWKLNSDQEQVFECKH